MDYKYWWPYKVLFFHSFYHFSVKQFVSEIHIDAITDIMTSFITSNQAIKVGS